MEIKTFPELIFVTVEQDGKDEWLSANVTKRGSLGDSGKVIVGVYKFVQAEEVREALPTFRRLKNRRTR